MIVLDTNVVSELMKFEPDQNVLACVDRFEADEVFLTAVTAAELLYGIARLPDGARKSRLRSRTEEVLDVDFADRVIEAFRVTVHCSV